MWLLWYKCVADQPEVLLDNRVIIYNTNPETMQFHLVESIQYYCIIYYLSITDEDAKL